MTLVDIIALEGIVVRLIPMTTTSRFGYRDGDEDRLRGNQTIVCDGDRKMVHQVKENALGGKYLVSFVPSQDSQVRFNVKRDGVGDTVEAAYDDYLAKRAAA